MQKLTIKIDQKTSEFLDHLVMSVIERSLNDKENGEMHFKRDSITTESVDIYLSENCPVEHNLQMMYELGFMLSNKLTLYNFVLEMVKRKEADNDSK